MESRAKGTHDKHESRSPTVWIRDERTRRIHLTGKFFLDYLWTEREAAVLSLDIFQAAI